ncbi:MAG: ABC transporter permease [Lachnospiraceae bacterium]|nr:ABC transporter permease [Lachnospiraceae bacterium]
MGKSRFFGWQNVFAFTFKQLIKNKANIILMAIMFVIALGMLPVMTMINGDTAKEKTTTIEKLIVVDETDLDVKSWLDVSAMEGDIAKPKSVEITTEKYDEEKLDLNSEENRNTGLVSIKYDSANKTFMFSGVYGAKGKVTEGDVNSVCALIRDNFNKQFSKSRNITEDKLEYLSAETVSETVKYDPDEKNTAEENAGKGPMINSGEYTLCITIICVVIMLVSMSGEQVASAVLQEKASKLVEFLLTSVKPLALLIGKVLAVFVVSIIDVLVMAAGFGGSTLINKVLFPDSNLSLFDTIGKTLSSTGGAEGAVELNPWMVPIGVLIILGGVLFYAVLAALAGACVSRIEELTEGMKLFSAVMIIGAYFGMFVCMMDMNARAPQMARNIALFAPLSSPVLMPSYLVFGAVGAAEGFISLAILLVSIALMFWFASQVYESMIYHKGTPLKIKDIITLFKRERSEKHE